MTDYAGLDFLTDQSLVADPYPYYDYLREQNPVLRLEPHGFVAVTGYDEALGVLAQQVQRVGFDGEADGGAGDADDHQHHHQLDQGEAVLFHRWLPGELGSV